MRRLLSNSRRIRWNYIETHLRAADLQLHVLAPLWAHLWLCFARFAPIFGWSIRHVCWAFNLEKKRGPHAIKWSKCPCHSATLIHRKRYFRVGYSWHVGEATFIVVFIQQVWLLESSCQCLLGLFVYSRANRQQGGCHHRMWTPRIQFQTLPCWRIRFGNFTTSSIPTKRPTHKHANTCVRASVRLQHPYRCAHAPWLTETLNLHINSTARCVM